MSTLVLVPTAPEARRLSDLGGFPERTRVELTGFGPVAAAARTAALLERERPERCLLVGIAGSYDVSRDPVGTALLFERVACEGIGVGCGAGFRPPSAVGFPQWPGSEESDAVDDELPLRTPAAPPGGLLLTTCGASDGPTLAAIRRERFPDARAEDMEGFGVALACALARVPLAIVRGLSNAAGDRTAAHWRIPAALAAARSLALEVLEEPDWTLEAPA